MVKYSGNYAVFNFELFLFIKDVVECLFGIYLNKAFNSFIESLNGIEMSSEDISLAVVFVFLEFFIDRFCLTSNALW